MGHSLMVAGFQMRPRKTPARVALAILRGMTWAVRRGARCLLTPEMILTGYHSHFKQEERDAAIRDILVPACRDLKITLFLGTGNKLSPSGRPYPRPRMELLVLGPEGKTLGAHHKVLLAGSDHDQFSPGSLRDLKVRRLGKIPYGLTICNDFWATPGFTRVPDPNLPKLWAEKGARVIFHAIASGWGASHLDFHNRRMEDSAARSGLWILSANTAYGRHRVNASSGILGPDGRWRLKASPVGERLFVGEMKV